MSKRVLITGGAGFIGSHLADELLRCGYAVRALDNLSPQVHGAGSRRPDYLDAEVELMVGDVRDESAVRHALEGIDVVYHLAAAVGVGQSMYQVADYVGVNGLGTAVLLEALIARPVERLIVASSMSIYGEGLYEAADGTRHESVGRTLEQLRHDQWEVRAVDGTPLSPVYTPESKRPDLSSIYAQTKYDQERMCLMIGHAYRIPTVALRLFNVYGTRQALSNPYTGVMAIFASRLLNGNRPLIFEDGLQQRDFVSVKDVARALRLALEVEAAGGEVFNIGSGRPIAIKRLAEKIADAVGKPHLEAEVTGQYRLGDIRHCFASIDHARRVLSYEPAVTMEDGLVELAEWLQGQVAEDRADQARDELKMRGLTV